MLIYRFTIIFSYLLFFSCVETEITPNYEKFVSEIGELNYRILYPKGFDESKSYPLTLFLHGIGYFFRTFAGFQVAPGFPFC